jgi:hypothetical protein
MNNYHYLLRDSNEIFGVYSTLDIAYNNLLQFIYNFYRYYKIMGSTTCNIRSILKNFQIIQYDNNVVINLYNIDNRFKLIDINSNIINSSTISIVDFISKLENISNNINSDDININSNDLNLFIPINFTETDVFNISENQKTNNSNYGKNMLPNDINRELTELQAKINLLGEMKENEKKSLEKIKKTTKTKEEQVFMEQIKNETIKQKFEQKKEYYEKTKNKFKIDKNIYFKIKEEIINGERDPNNLPQLFIEEYNIFSKLEKNNLLDLESSDNIFQEYLKYKPEKKQNFSTLFDNIFNNENWNNHNSDNSSSDDNSSDDNDNN